MLRTRRTDGRFGTWESRTAPAAGGLHGIALLVLPLEEEEASGIYDDTRHGLLAPPSMRLAVRGNRASVLELTGAFAGTTLQLVADRGRYSACYRNCDTLIWRDAGALSATISLIATSLSMTSVVLGRNGDAIVRDAGLDRPWIGVGAVHLGTRTD